MKTKRIIGIAIAATMILSASSLGYAQYGGDTWSVEIVEESGGGVPSLAFGPDGEPAIAHCVLPYGALKYTYYSSGVWRTVVVDSSSATHNISMAFGPSGLPVLL